VALPDAEGYVDCIGNGETVDSLKEEGEGQTVLQLHNHRRFVASHSHDIAWSDLTFHPVALGLQEPLDRIVKFHFRHWILSFGSLHWDPRQHGSAHGMDR
jgi:hypothetical protein